MYRGEFSFAGIYFNYFDIMLDRVKFLKTGALSNEVYFIALFMLQSPFCRLKMDRVSACELV